MLQALQTLSIHLMRYGVGSLALFEVIQFNITFVAVPSIELGLPDALR